MNQVVCYTYILCGIYQKGLVAISVHCSKLALPTLFWRVFRATEHHCDVKVGSGCLANARDWDCERALSSSANLATHYSSGVESLSSVRLSPTYLCLSISERLVYNQVLARVVCLPQHSCFCWSFLFPWMLQDLFVFHFMFLVYMLREWFCCLVFDLGKYLLLNALASKVAHDICGSSRSHRFDMFHCAINR